MVQYHENVQRNKEADRDEKEHNGILKRRRNGDVQRRYRNSGIHGRISCIRMRSTGDYSSYGYASAIEVKTSFQH